MRISEDLHFHSTFSDGAHSVATNLLTARARGLKRVCCVDHVRRDTPWVPDFVAEVNRQKRRYQGEMEVFVGVEAKLLDTRGHLDLPEDLTGVDFIYAADHRFPLSDGLYTPSEVRSLLANGQLSPRVAVESLVMATMRAMQRYPNVVVAHLFSILPKVGLGDYEIPEVLIRVLADFARQKNIPLEVNERWQCPAPRVIRLLQAAGAPLCFGTDAHACQQVGRYDYCLQALCPPLQVFPQAPRLAANA